MAKINAKLCKIRKNYRSPQKYAEYVLRQLEHRKNLASLFIISDFSSMQPNRLYKPAEIRGEINKYMQPEAPADVSDLVGALESEEGEYVTAKDMSKALKTLENEIELVRETTKQGVKNSKGKQKNRILRETLFLQIATQLRELKKSNNQSQSNRTCI